MTADVKQLFARSRTQVRVIDTVRKTMFRLLTTDAEGKPGGGTAILMRRLPDGTGLLATAAHLVDRHHDLRICHNGTREPIPVSRFVWTTEERRELRNGDRPLSGFRLDPDVAVLRSESVPNGAEHACPTADDVQPFPPGSEVICGGYAGIEDPWAATFTQGMISASFERRTTQQWVYSKYVVDASINKGMSGGPVFCPESGITVAIITESWHGIREIGHGWGLASPTAELFKAFRMRLAQLRGGEPKS